MRCVQCLANVRKLTQAMAAASVFWPGPVMVPCSRRLRPCVTTFRDSLDKLAALLAYTPGHLAEQLLPCFHRFTGCKVLGLHRGRLLACRQPARLTVLLPPRTSSIPYKSVPCSEPYGSFTAIVSTLSELAVERVCLPPRRAGWSRSHGTSHSQ